ncbi:MAG: hypothetical protein K2K86_05685 [Muribaculaceae bacterium]|nr:hypothetical protein [Muribaculaceae bacterium]MDE7385858.1 hypothetical protein [Muribaculaceae bacterium]
MNTTRQHNSDNRDRALAATATVTFHAVLLIVCLTTVLRTPREAVIRSDSEPENEITFEEVIDLVAGGSYTEPQPVPEPIPEPQLSQGSQVDAAPAPAPDPEVIQQQRRDEIARRVKFATTTVDETEGDGGDAPVTSASTSDVDADKIGLEGFTSEGFPSPGTFSSTGTIAISITVDASGRILAAEFQPTLSNGAIKNNRQAIAACRQAAMKSRFSARPGTTTGGTGTIFYHFRK